MSFSDVSAFFIILSIYVELGKVSVSDLVWGPWGENDNVVVVILVRLLLLQVFLSLFGNNIESKFLIVVVPDPGIGLDFGVDLLDELLSLFKSDVGLFLVYKGLFLSDLFLGKIFAFFLLLMGLFF